VAFNYVVLFSDSQELTAFHFPLHDQYNNIKYQVKVAKLIMSSNTWWLGHIIRKIGFPCGSSGLMNEASTLYRSLKVSASAFIGNCALGLPERSFNTVKFEDAPSHKRIDTLKP
jgi:hypothetical protein